jgi:hypothetical protein
LLARERHQESEGAEQETANGVLSRTLVHGPREGWRVRSPRSGSRGNRRDTGTTAPARTRDTCACWSSRRATLRVPRRLRRGNDGPHPGNGARPCHPLFRRNRGHSLRRRFGHSAGRSTLGGASRRATLSDPAADAGFDGLPGVAPLFATARLENLEVPVGNGTTRERSRCRELFRPPEIEPPASTRFATSRNARAWRLGSGCAIEPSLPRAGPRSRSRAWCVRFRGSNDGLTPLGFGLGFFGVGVGVQCRSFTVSGFSLPPRVAAVGPDNECQDRVHTPSAFGVGVGVGFGVGVGVGLGIGIERRSKPMSKSEGR